jgi:parvulin-like peptidyl-prolyl isomerase
MKLLIVLSLLVVLPALRIDPAQVRKDLQSVKTVQQAEAYLSRSGLKGNVLELDQIRDSSAAAMKLFAAKTGEVIEQTSADKATTYFYKALTSKESETDRVQYIFFDNTKVPKARIDSLRTVVMKRLKSRETFAALAKEYSMDRSGKRGGDSGWYDRAVYAQGFVSAVKSHAKGDVFLVDLPAEKWYYVVRKSHDPLKRKQIAAIYVAVPSK